MIRLVLLIFLFLLSLLTIFKAPAYYLWLVAILVSEYPLIFVGLSIILTSLGIWYVPYRIYTSLFGLLSIILFISPILRAGRVSNSLKQEMDLAFDIKKQQQLAYPARAAFSLAALFASKPTIPVKSLKYVSYKDISLNLDFYPSSVSGKRACVIVVHGGSWSSGDNKQVPELNSYLATKGYHVAAINYRLAPKYHTPAPVEDINNCILYLKEHAESLNIDTNRFILLGRSAGAQIVLLSAYTLQRKEIIGVIDFYGPADMVWGYSAPSNPLIMDSRKVMENYIGGTYPNVPSKYIACSPLEFVDETSPATLIIHGANDVLVDYEHSQRLDEKLEQHGVKHYWLKLPWATHAFDYNMNGPGGQLSTYAVETFSKNVTSN